MNVMNGGGYEVRNFSPLQLCLSRNDPAIHPNANKIVRNPMSDAAKPGISKISTFQ